MMKIGDAVRVITTNGAWDGHITYAGDKLVTVQSNDGFQRVIWTRRLFTKNGDGWTLTFR